MEQKPLEDRIKKIADGIFAGPKHPECLAPRITLDGVKTCRESKPEILWCEKCAKK